MEDNFVFGFDMWDEILDFFHIERKNNLLRIMLVFETSEDAQAVIFYDDETICKSLPIHGIMSIKELFGLPNIAQKIVITGTYGEWTTVEYRFVTGEESIKKAFDLVTKGTLVSHGDNV